MALVVTNDAIKQEQPKYYGTMTVAMDASYPNAGPGGYPLDWVTYLPAGAVLMGTLVDSNGDFFFHYDAANKKLQAFDSTTGAEVANGVSLAAVTGLRVTFVGV